MPFTNVLKKEDASSNLVAELPPTVSTNNIGTFRPLPDKMAGSEVIKKSKSANDNIFRPVGGEIRLDKYPEYKTVVNSLSSLLDKLGEAEQKLSQLQQENNTKNIAIDGLNTEIARLEREIEKLKSDKGSEEQELAEKEKLIEDQLKTLSDEISRLQKLQQENDKKTEEIEGLNKEIVELNKIIEGLRSTILLDERKIEERNRADKERAKVLSFPSNHSVLRTTINKSTAPKEEPVQQKVISPVIMEVETPSITKSEVEPINENVNLIETTTSKKTVPVIIEDIELNESVDEVTPEEIKAILVRGAGMANTRFDRLKGKIGEVGTIVKLAGIANEEQPEETIIKTPHIEEKVGTPKPVEVKKEDLSSSPQNTNEITVESASSKTEIPTTQSAESVPAEVLSGEDSDWFKNLSQKAQETIREISSISERDFASKFFKDLNVYDSLVKSNLTVYNLYNDMELHIEDEKRVEASSFISVLLMALKNTHELDILDNIINIKGFNLSQFFNESQKLIKQAYLQGNPLPKK